jgi:hypothetical protein
MLNEFFIVIIVHQISTRVKRETWLICLREMKLIRILREIIKEMSFWISLEWRRRYLDQRHTKEEVNEYK